MKKFLQLLLVLGLSLLCLYYCRSPLPKGAEISALYDAPIQWIAGNPNGSVTVVEFFDYLCPFCKKEQYLLLQLIKKNPDVRLIYKGYALYGDQSLPALKGAIAAARQENFLSFHNAMIGSLSYPSEEQALIFAQGLSLDLSQFRRDVSDPSVLNEIRGNGALADSLNIRGAPTFYFTQTRILTASNPDHIPQITVSGYLTLSELNTYLQKITPPRN